MGMLAFLLDTKLGHMLIGVLCILIAGAGMYWRGHNKGWDSAVKHDKAVVSACMAANDRDARTISNLEASNREWSDAAAAAEAKAAEAVKRAAADARASAQAVADAQAKLHKIEAQHGDAHAAAVTHIPPAVYRVICTDGVCEPADRTH
ncbi:MAG: hypothetical protein KGL35_06395 [Bradyrhizobium sp.]|nr:hypothetical protein [Bradyrhizobium sp.]